MYPVLSREKYQKLSLLQRLKRDGRKIDEINNVKNAWLNKLEEFVGEDTLWIHREKLVYELKNLPKDQLEPMQGFSMKSAELLAEFIKTHAVRNSEIMQQAMAEQPSDNSRKRPAADENPNKDKGSKKKTNFVSLSG